MVSNAVAPKETDASTRIDSALSPSNVHVLVSLSCRYSYSNISDSAAPLLERTENSGVGELVTRRGEAVAQTQRRLDVPNSRR